ncbi:MAG: DUF2069 domain-containing protein, partial [Steroidobacter sp.]
IALIAFVAAWLLLDELSMTRAALAGAVTLPLWAALPGLLNRRQRTYAWMTLAVIPYLVFAIVEAIANSQARSWAGVCLFVGFTLFVTLIGFLRVVRRQANA